MRNFFTLLCFLIFIVSQALAVPYDSDNDGIIDAEAVETIQGYQGNRTLSSYTGDLDDIDISSDYWITAAGVTNDPGDDGISSLTWNGQGVISTRYMPNTITSFATQTIVDGSISAGRWFYRQQNNFGSWGFWTEGNIDWTVDQGGDQIAPTNYVHDHPPEDFAPTAFTIVDGDGTITNGGTYPDLATQDDNDIIIQEATGSPGYNLEVTFGSLTSINNVTVYGWYDGWSGHTIDVEIQDPNDLSWDYIDSINIGTEDTWYSFPIFNGANYIDGSNNAKIRFHHPDSGNTLHDLYLDQVILRYAAGSVAGGVSDHGSLSGREHDDHPQYLKVENPGTLSSDELAAIQNAPSVPSVDNAFVTETDLAGKEDSGEAQSIMTTHENSHPVPTFRDVRNQAVMLFTFPEYISMGGVVTFVSTSAVCDTQHVDYNTAIAEIATWGLYPNVNIDCATFAAPDPDRTATIVGLAGAGSLGTVTFSGDSPNAQMNVPAFSGTAYLGTVAFSATSPNASVDIAALFGTGGLGAIGISAANPNSEQVDISALAGTSGLGTVGVTFEDPAAGTEIDLDAVSFNSAFATSVVWKPTTGSTTDTTSPINLSFYADPGDDSGAELWRGFIGFNTPTTHGADTVTVEAGATMTLYVDSVVPGGSDQRFILYEWADTTFGFNAADFGAIIAAESAQTGVITSAGTVTFNLDEAYIKERLEEGDKIGYALLLEADDETWGASYQFKTYQIRKDTNPPHINFTYSVD